MKTNRRSGLSLLEVLIASVILVGVCIAAFATLFTATTLSSKGTAASEIETRGTRFLAGCRDDMAAAQYGGTINLGTGFALGLGVNPKTPSNGATSGYTAVAYQIPGNRTTNGTKKTGGLVGFGYSAPTNLPGEDDDGAGPLTGSTNYSKYYEELVCYLRFEADTVFKESSSSLDATQSLDWDTGTQRYFTPYPALVNPSSSNLPNQILSKDLNGDGDMTDTYVRGKIVKYVFTPKYTPFTDPASVTPHPVYTNHGSGVTINGQAMYPVLLSREVVTDMVMLRVNSTTAGDFYCDFDGHSPSLHSDLDAIFRYVGPSGGVDEAMVGQPSGTNPLTVTPSPIDSTNAKGILICVIHGDFDGTPKGFVFRKNKQLIRTKTDQSNPGGS
jgi:Tfp pilus assembly protein PilV